MVSNLEQQFGKIGARIKFIDGIRSRNRAPNSSVRLNVITKGGEEMFEIAIDKRAEKLIDLSVLELRAQDRHLVLLARTFDQDGQVVSKEHFLCGHDERHLFVAAVKSVSSVMAAKASLKPPEIKEQEIGLNSTKRNRRKTKVFKRQGEWFFLPVNIKVNESLIIRDEPMRRSNSSKAHVAQFAYRVGGEQVKVCSRYPEGISLKEFADLIKNNPHVKNFGWREMKKNPTLYVKGKVRHPDHATIQLQDWHRVMMNTEVRSAAVAFLD